MSEEPRSTDPRSPSTSASAAGEPRSKGTDSTRTGPNGTGSIPGSTAARDGAFCRAAELEQLVELVSASLATDGVSSAATVAPSLVLLGGGSGMGKTRLFDETRAAAERLGVCVRETFCYERQGIPFLPILRLVKEMIGESGDRLALWRRYAHVLSRVFPELSAELGEEEPPIELPDEAGKTQFFDALTSIIGELSREQPLLLMVHDLHRSDRGTVEFIEYLARNAHLQQLGRRPETAALSAEEESRGWREIRSREGRRGEYLGEGLAPHAGEIPETGARWMVIANHRAPDGGSTTEVTPSIPGVIDTLAREPFAARIDLSPLGEPEVRAIASCLLGPSGLSTAAARRLAFVTGGNPLSVIEACRAVQGGVDIDALLEDLEREPPAAEVAPIIEDVAAPAPPESARTESSEKEVETGKSDAKKSDPKKSDPKKSDAKKSVAKKSDAEGPVTVEATAEPETLDAVRRGVCAGRLVRRRLDRMDETPRATLEVLAVLRRPAPARSLEAILDRDAESIAADLAYLRAEGFAKSIELQGAERWFLVHEDHVRWTYEAIEDERRRRWHARIGHFLSEQQRAHEPVRAYEIYEHLRLGETPRGALPSGLTAARYFARAYAGELAVRILREILPMLESDADAPARLGHLYDLSILEAQHDDLSVAKTHIKQVIESEGLSAGRRVDAGLHLAEIYLTLDEPLKGLKSLNRLPKETIDEAAGLAMPRISEMRARLRLQRQDPKRAISLCLRGLQELDAIAEAEEPAAPTEEIAFQRARLQECLADAHIARGDQVSAIHGYQTLLDLVEELGDDVLLARVLRRVGRVYYDRGNHFRAARYLFRALEVIGRTQDIRALSSTYDLLGKVYRNSGDFLRSLEYFRRSLHLRERIGDKEGLSPTLNSTGSLYAHNGDYERAIRYFKRSLSNSERSESTAGIVRALLHLGWVYHDLGERKQVESLAKQILILAQEFNLSELEGEGHRLQGNLGFLRGNWKQSEREFRRSLEIAQRRGLVKLEAASHLDLGMLLAEREDVDGALKRITKGLLLAEEMQAIPLQVRGHVLKGQIARQLKGGTPERAIESYRRGLELVAGGTLLPLQFELESAMARTHQSNLDFEAARGCYERAERIFEQVSAGLPDDMRVVYQDDRRRKNFLDDLQRFQKEASGRTSVPLALTSGSEAPRSRRSLPVPAEAAGGGAFVQVLTAIDGLAAALTVQEWATALLSESRRLAPAPRGFLWEESGSGGGPLARSDMGPEEEWSHGRFPARIAARAIADERVILSTDPGWDALVEELDGDGAMHKRSVAVVPVLAASDFRGALYLERPTVGNPFGAEEIELLRQLLLLGRGQLTALVEVRRLRTFEGTHVLTAGGFDLECPDFVEGLRRRGESLGSIEVVVPGFDLLLSSRRDETVVEEFVAVAGPGCSHTVRLGGDRYVFLFPGESIDAMRARRESIAAELTELRTRHSVADENEVMVRVQAIESGDDEAKEMLAVYRSQLFRGGEFSVDEEISQLTSGEMSLKEAKTALEKRYITSELLKSGGNITRAAESLGVHRPQLSTLIKKHRVRREDFEPS